MDRKSSINSAQKDLLVQFMKDHEDLQTGRFTKSFTFKKAQTLWEEVTTTLNIAYQMGGRKTGASGEKNDCISTTTQKTNKKMFTKAPHTILVSKDIDDDTSTNSEDDSPRAGTKNNKIISNAKERSHKNIPCTERSNEETSLNTERTENAHLSSSSSKTALQHSSDKTSDSQFSHVSKVPSKVVSFEGQQIAPFKQGPSKNPYQNYQFPRSRKFCSVSSSGTYQLPLSKRDISRPTRHQENEDCLSHSKENPSGAEEMKDELGELAEIYDCNAEKKDCEKDIFREFAEEELLVIELNELSAKSELRQKSIGVVTEPLNLNFGGRTEAKCHCCCRELDSTKVSDSKEKSKTEPFKVNICKCDCLCTGLEEKDINTNVGRGMNQKFSCCCLKCPFNLHLQNIFYEK